MNMSEKLVSKLKSIDRVKILGIIILIIGLSFIFLHKYPKDWPCNVLISNFYANFSAEFISIAITILLIDHLYEVKEKKNLKSRLIRELGSEENGLTSRALKELKENGWLENGTLTNADLKKANLTDLDLSGANLEGSDLSFADLSKSNLTNANLKNCNLSETKFRNSVLENCQLDNAKAHKAIFYEATLHKITACNTDFLAANMGLVLLTNAKIENSKFDGANFELTTLSKSKFVNCELSQVNFESSNVKDATFERCNLLDIKNWNNMINKSESTFLSPKNAPHGFL